MYPTLTGLMFVAIIVICPPCPCLSLQHHLVTPCFWLDSIQLTPDYYGPWVDCYIFMICMYKHCFLPLLLVLVMKCFVYDCIALCLTTGARLMYRHTDIYRPIWWCFWCIVLAKFRRYISAIFAHKNVALLLYDVLHGVFGNPSCCFISDPD